MTEHGATEVSEHHLRFRLADTAGYDALLRVVSIMHRQDLHIRSLHFDRQTDGCATIAATIATTGHRAQRLIRICANSAQILEVLAAEGPIDQCA